MKKGLLIIAAAMLVGFTANAQLSIGAGYQGHMRDFKVNTNATSSPISDTSAWYNGFYAGFNYNIHLVAGLNIAPGLHFNYNHHSEEDAFGKIKDVEMGLKLPVLVNYRFNFRNGKFIFAPYAGITFGFAISGKTTYEIAGIKTTEDDFDKDVYDGVNAPSRFDMYASAGIMLMFNHFRVNAGIDAGMLNRYSSFSSDFLGVTAEPELSLLNLNIGIGYEF